MSKGKLKTRGGFSLKPFKAPTGSVWFGGVLVRNPFQHETPPSPEKILPLHTET